MRMSSSTTSGLSFLVSLTASSPLVASPTIFTSDPASRLTSPRRTTS
jgi:hypothetical protein